MTGHLTRLLLVLASLGATSVRAEPFGEGMVSITFDDGHRTQSSFARGALARHGYKATFYLNPGSLSGWAMTWDDARALAADGHEIGSHTTDHVRLTDASDAELAHQLAGSASDPPALTRNPVALANDEHR